MTPDLPKPAELLQTASDVLKRDILPEAGGRKLDILMIMNILGVAKRALEDDGGLAERQAARYAELPGGEGDAEALSASIRSGRYDEGEDARTLYRILSEDVRDRLSLAAPGYLETALKEE